MRPLPPAFRPGEWFSNYGGNDECGDGKSPYFILIAIELAAEHIVFYYNFIIITVITEFMYMEKAGGSSLY